MAYRVQVTLDVFWVGDGVGSVMLGQSQANVAGFGQTQTPGAVGNAQTRRYQTAEQVPGGDAPTLANLNTALAACVTDFAGASGTPIITAAELAIIQGWASGNP